KDMLTPESHRNPELRRRRVQAHLGRRSFSSCPPVGPGDKELAGSGPANGANSRYLFPLLLHRL
ncbi:hypothetical protein BaRGS_00014416, partial [Batillaria attramentaria]